MVPGFLKSVSFVFAFALVFYGAGALFRLHGIVGALLPDALALDAAAWANACFPFLLALVMFRTTAFCRLAEFGWSTLSLVLTIAAGLGLAAGVFLLGEATASRLPRADERLAQMREQSWAMTLPERRLAAGPGLWFQPGKRTDAGFIDSVLVLDGGRRFYSPVRVAPERGTWLVTGGFLVQGGTVVRHERSELPVRVAGFLPGPPHAVSFFGFDLGDWLQRFTAWPARVAALPAEARATEAALFLAGLVLFAAGLGLLVHVDRAALARRFAVYLLFLLCLAFPVWAWLELWGQLLAKGSLAPGVAATLRGGVVLLAGTLVLAVGALRAKRKAGQSGGEA